MGNGRPPLEPVPPPWDEDGWNRFVREPGDYEPPATAPVIVRVADVKVEPITWLWQDRIPQAALVLLDGHPDTGKSTITLDLASRLSRGRRMPDGSRGLTGSTLLLNTEDTLAKPVRERLEAAEANLDHVYGLEVTDKAETLPRPLIFPEDTAVLERAIMQVDAKLVVIDPIMGHLSATVSANNDQELRRALTPLARVASATGATILLVRHLKAPDSKAAKTAVPSYLEGSGSKGGFGITRGGLVAMRDPDDPSISTLHVTKHNYSRWARPVDYTFEQGETHGVGRIRWLPR